MKKYLLFLLLILLSSSFTLAQLPGSPILIEPPKEASVVSLTPTLIWETVPGADCYFIYITSDTLSVPPPEVCMTTTNSYSIPSGILVHDGQYYWRVQAHNSFGWGPSSEFFAFHTLTTSVLGNIDNIRDQISGITSAGRLNTVQANILGIKLDQAVHQLELENYPVSILHMFIFKLRVHILQMSGMLPLSDANSLRYSADGVIDLIETLGPQGVLSKEPEIPQEFALRQNYPNPFNPVTTIEYTIPENSFVTLRVYDLLGKEIAVIINKYQEKGSYITMWDASSLSSGIYIYNLTAGSHSESKKMILGK